MRVARLEKQPTQRQLFEDGLTVAACRNATGDFYEEATRVAFGGVRIRIDSRADVCPDIRLPDGAYIESKSIGRGAAAMGYESRLEKDVAFMDHGHVLYYALWRHRFSVRDGITATELHAGLAAATESVTILEARDFVRIMRAGPLMTLNKANGGRSRTAGTRRGYGNDGYTDGYRQRLVNLQTAGTIAKRSLLVYGHAIEGARLYWH